MEMISAHHFFDVIMGGTNIRPYSFFGLFASSRFCFSFSSLTSVLLKAVGLSELFRIP